jgi:hypothetical protein
MTQKFSRTGIDPIPLRRVARRMAYVGAMAPGYPLQPHDHAGMMAPPDWQSAPMGSEAHVERPGPYSFSLLECGSGTSFSAAVFLRFHFDMPDLPDS